MPHAREHRGVLRDLPPEAMPPPPAPRARAVWSVRAVFWITILLGPDAGFVLATLNALTLGLRDRARHYAALAGVTLVLVTAYYVWVDATSNPFAQGAPNPVLYAFLLVPSIIVALYLKDRLTDDVEAYRIQDDVVRDVRTRDVGFAILVAVIVTVSVAGAAQGILRLMGVPWA